jgi:hypothetical protein
MKRPIGVTILAVMTFLSVLNLAGNALLLFGAGSPLARLITWPIAAFGVILNWPSNALLALALMVLPISLPALGGLHVFLAVLFFVVAMALMRVQNWARIVIAVLAVLNITTAIAGFAIPRLLLFRQAPIKLAMDLVILVYLFQAKTREAFGAKSG